MVDRTARAYTPATVAAEVVKIREEIRVHGTCVVGCNELGILCPDVISDKDRNRGIEEIATWEGWLTEILPEGTIRFSSFRKT